MRSAQPYITSKEKFVLKEGEWGNKFLGKYKPLVELEVKENRIYIWVEFTRKKKFKTAILLYCFHAGDVLHIFVLYNLLGPGTSFLENLKLIWKETQIMK